jgi:hypothetical protein
VGVSELGRMVFGIIEVVKFNDNFVESAVIGFADV